MPVPVPATDPRFGRLGSMAFDHERLDVYQVALEFLTLAEKVIAGLPRGRSHLADQLARASLSIVLNIAEGAGKVSGPDKRRYYLSARGSATESAARLDVYLRLLLAGPDDHRAGKEMLERIVGMLVRLAKSFEASGTGTGTGTGSGSGSPRVQGTRDKTNA